MTTWPRWLPMAALLVGLAACSPDVTPPTPHAAPAPSSSRTTTSTAPTPEPRVSPSPGELSTLRGDTRNAIAWAPLSEPDDVTVEGSVPRSRAWSTSKVLVIAAYLDTVVDGDPAEVPEDTRGWIRAALTRSDGEAIGAIRQRLEDPGAAMTRVLRAIGDTTTTAPDSHEGSMSWDIREQVRFMAALGNGRVVSPEASEFLLDQMQPIPAQRWGLGAIGARAFKPGWVSAATETRQMGIVGDYAVAIITDGEGPATIQSDGDYAHEWQLNRLARLLARRLDSGSR
ncbi:MAG TPA: hypothetical protein VM093_02695 [Aeromicrobium sp.]|nr:hypothetical protein [Aeromicrobium sp.]